MKLKQITIKEAIKSLEKGLDIKRDISELNLNLAFLYFNRNYLKKAEYYCARALWFRKNHAKSYDLMGNIYFHQGNYQDALNEYSNMLNLENHNATAHYNLGVVYVHLNKQKEAEVHLIKAIEFDRIMKEVIKKSKNRSTDLSSSVAVRVKPISFLSYKVLGELYFNQGRIEESTKMYEQAIKINPNFPEIYLGLAKIYLNKNEIKKTEALLKKYLYLGGSKKEADILYNIIRKRDNSP